MKDGETIIIDLPQITVTYIDIDQGIFGEGLCGYRAYAHGDEYKYGWGDTVRESVSNFLDQVAKKQIEEKRDRTTEGY